jgi:hypothetical protein
MNGHTANSRYCRLHDCHRFESFIAKIWLGSNAEEEEDLPMATAKLLTFLFSDIQVLQKFTCKAPGVQVQQEVTCEPGPLKRLTGTSF